MVEQSTAATHSLKGETAELVRLLSRFQVSEGRAGQRPREAESYDAPARNPVAEQRARLGAFTRPAARGGAAAAAAPSADAWEEF